MAKNISKYSGKQQKYSIAVLSCCVILLTSCDNFYDNEGRNPLFVKAENFYNEGKYDKAVSLYQKYLEINPKSAATNYRLANIFQQKQDYIRAIFHYEKHIDLKPNSSDKEVISRLIQASKVSLAKQLAEQSSVNLHNISSQSIKIVSEPETMPQNTIPTTQISQNSTLPLTQPSNKKIQPEEQPLKTKHYIVKEGDTLQKISKKLYGSSKYYKLIIDANKEGFKNSTMLKIGDKIIIPQIDSSVLSKT